MAAITASNVSYTRTSKSDISEQGYRSRYWTLAFGNGTLTYPSGGIPLSKNMLGMPYQVKSLLINDMSHADGYIYKYDATNNTIRIFTGGASTSVPLVELSTAATPAATSLQVIATGY